MNEKVEVTYAIEVRQAPAAYPGEARITVTETWRDHIKTTTHDFGSEAVAHAFIASHPLLSSI